MRSVVRSLLLLLLLCSSAVAEPLRLPLEKGKFSVGNVAEAVGEELGIEVNCGWLDCAQLDVVRVSQSSIGQAVQNALGDSLTLQVTDGELELSLSDCGIRRTLQTAKGVVRNVVARIEPEVVSERYASYGLLMPENCDDRRPLVLLIHGLNASLHHWDDMTALLKEDGFQVAYFVYPNDQSIVESVGMLTAAMGQLANDHPNACVDILSHSLGGIVARGYVEGEEYHGQVRRVISLCPPNHGSRMAHFAMVTELYEHYLLKKNAADWHWAWCIADGLGEAGNELTPSSCTIAELNERSRRDGVRYTIITGNQHSLQRYARVAMQQTAENLVGDSEGFVARKVKAKVAKYSARLSGRTGSSDGAVRLDSAILEGVEDVVVVPADHTTIYCSRDGRGPVAWPAIRDRLHDRGEAD